MQSSTHRVLESAQKINRWCPRKKVVCYTLHLDFSSKIESWILDGSFWCFCSSRLVEKAICARNNLFESFLREKLCCKIFLHRAHWWITLPPATPAAQKHSNFGRKKLINSHLCNNVKFYCHHMLILSRGGSGYHGLGKYLYVIHINFRFWPQFWAFAEKIAVIIS